MYTVHPSVELADYRQYAIWIISIVLVAFGFRYIKELITLVLEKLYEVFIQQNPGL